jgi:hypothetical protein
LSTLLHFHRYRREKVYTITSDQTHRDSALGEIEETVVNRDSATGVIALGAEYGAIKKEAKKTAWEVNRLKILRYIKSHDGKTTDEFATGVKMSKPDVLPYLASMIDNNDIHPRGEGVKGDPKKYFANSVTVGQPTTTVEPESQPLLEDEIAKARAYLADKELAKQSYIDSGQGDGKSWDARIESARVKLVNLEAQLGTETIQ